MKKYLISILVTLIFAFIAFYITLPPLNISSPAFWGFMFFNISIFFISYETCKYVFSKVKIQNNSKSYKKYLIYLVFALILIINFFFTPFFQSNSYYTRINVEDGNFEQDIPEADFSQLALLDKESTTKLGDRVMGQLTDLVSQFYVSPMYTQITFNDEISRVTPLEHTDFIKWINNRKEGIPGYITVNSVTGESNLTRLDSGMKYAESAYFNEDLHRALRFQYPTSIFGDINFEIDDEGNPYWIAQILKYTSVGIMPEVDGVIVFDPITGNSTKYSVSDVPDWIDNVYNSNLILDQLSDWGSYKNGFLNSIFTQKDVVMTTEGYNYIAMNNDIYLYTGITSVVSDESNVGFVMVNLRTKETKFYNVAGAEEFSAMSSAEGQVQQMDYTSTFPLLINLNDRPTYLLSLKDNAGLVKMYAFVDYQDYQKVVVEDSSMGIEEIARKYSNTNISSTGESLIATIQINNITSAVLDSSTVYYIQFEDMVYRLSLKVDETIVPFLKIGDTITINYIEGNINEITSLEYSYDPNFNTNIPL